MLPVFIVNSIVIAVVVIIHYEFLYRLTLHLQRIRIRHRFLILLGVFGAMIAHTIEVWVFALAYYFMHHAQGWGHLSGGFDGSVLDCVYFSFSTYTTLGYGDIDAIGDLRHLTGLEALTGLVMITWSASFLFIEMQRYWKPNDLKG
ncbi:MAG: potassium channel family protein [Gammaproteobacteria bacterium]|nr:potassium channel family protein [Gammaproteobacteria bacterium]